MQQAEILKGIDKPGTEISEDEALKLLEYPEECPILGAALELLFTHLFLPGLKAYLKDNENKGEEDIKRSKKRKREKKPMEGKEEEKEEEEEEEEENITNKPKSQPSGKSLDPLLDAVIKCEWNWCLQEILLYLIAIGYVVVTIAMSEFFYDGKKFIIPVPVVIPRDEYEIRIFRDEYYRPHYWVRLKNRTEEEQRQIKVLVYSLPRKEPKSKKHDFSHNTILKRLLPKYNQLLTLGMSNDMAIQQRACPPVITEYEKEPSNNVSYSSIFNMDTQQRETVTNTGESISSVVDDTSGVNGIARIDILQSYLESYKRGSIMLYKQSIDINKNPLPAGRKLASGGAPMAEVPAEYLQHIDLYSATVFGNLGLPRSHVFDAVNSKYGTTPGTDLDNKEKQQINATAQYYAIHLLRIVNEILGESDLEGKENIRFGLSIFSPLTITQAAMLEDLDYISSDMAKESIYQTGGMMSIPIFRGQNSHERPGYQRSENTTKGMIQARENNINADTKLKGHQNDKLDAEVKQIKHEILHPPKTASS